MATKKKTTTKTSSTKTAKAPAKKRARKAPAAKAAPKKSVKKVSRVSAPRIAERDDEGEMASIEERIAVAAYYRAEQRGFAPGGELEDWLAAERWVSAG